MMTLKPVVTMAALLLAANTVWASSWMATKRDDGGYRAYTTTLQNEFFVIDFEINNCSKFSIGLAINNDDNQSTGYVDKIGTMTIKIGDKTWAIPFGISVTDKRKWFLSDSTFDYSLLDALMSEKSAASISGTSTIVKMPESTSLVGLEGAGIQIKQAKTLCILNNGSNPLFPKKTF